MIKLANKSRNNRMFVDQLIRELAICINTGDKEINREMLMPSYKSHKENVNIYADNELYQQITRDSGCLWTPLSECLSKKTLDELDLMLQRAPHELTRCNSRSKIQDFIMEYTDLVDCHFDSLNYMTSIR